MRIHDFRSWWIVIVLMALSVGCVPSALEAQDDAPRIASTPLRVNTTKLRTLWFDAMNFLETDDVNGFSRKIEEIDLLKVTSGFNNLPIQSEVLIKHALALKEMNRIDDALAVSEAAKQLSPDYAPVHFALARFHVAKDIKNVYGFARDWFFGMLAYFQDIGTVVVYANNGLSILVVAGFLAGIVFLLFSFAYYRQAIFYFYFKQILPLPLPMLIVNILGWLVIAVIVLTLGVSWGLLFLALSLIPHVEAGSKRMLQTLLLFGSVLPILLIAIATTYTFYEGDYFQALRELSYGTFSSKTATVLQQELQESPGDAYALFGLAYIASHTDQDQAAIEAYDDIPGNFPGRAAVQNNLGTLYHQRFLTNRDPQTFGQAEDAYNSAILMAPRMFEPRYNSGQLLMVDFQQSADAEDQLAAARRFDQDRFTQQSSYLEYGLVTVKATLSLGALLKKVIDPSSLKPGMEIAKHIWSGGSRFDNPLYFSAASFVVLILSLLFSPSKSASKKVTYCQMCGDPFTVKKRRKKRRKNDDDHEGKRGDSSNYCTQCTYIFKKKTTVKPEKRTQKVNQIQLRQKLRGLIAKVGSLVFPGAGQIYFGYPLKGGILALGFSLGASIVLLKWLSNSLLVVEGSAGRSLLTLGIGIFLMVVAYVFNLYDISKLSPKNQ